MLNEVKVPFYINKNMEYLGTDNPNSNHIKEVFNNDLTQYFNHPYKISYNFNSRGFRDTEWPVDLNNRIWCVGDSAALGAGVPVEYRYSSLLPNSINVSRILADNDWIYNNAVSILKETNPKLVVIQWSFYHRNNLNGKDQFSVEQKDSTKQAMLSLLGNYIKNKFTDREKFDCDYLFHLTQKIESVKKDSNVIHVLTPKMHVGFDFLNRVKDSVKYSITADWIDDARDITFHYGVQSHNNIADKIKTLCHEQNINIW